MSLLDRGNAIGDQYFECRHCGTAVEDAETPCPTCDSEEIGEYRF